MNKKNLERIHRFQEGLHIPGLIVTKSYALIALFTNPEIINNFEKDPDRTYTDYEFQEMIGPEVDVSTIRRNIEKFPHLFKKTKEYRIKKSGGLVIFNVRMFREECTHVFKEIKKVLDR